MESGLKKRTWFFDFINMLPAFVFTLSILLVRLHQFSMPLNNVYWTEATDSTTLSDLFSYWKSIAILCAAFLSVVVLIVGYFKDAIRIKKSHLYIPLFIYSSFVLLSYIFSDYKYFALHGMQEHFEGTFVLIAYVVMLFFLFNAVDNERRVKFVICCALGAMGLLCVLGITQATGHDFFTTAVGQKMITPNYMLDIGIKSWDLIDILSEQGQQIFGYTFFRHESYQTLYNPNYVGLYMTLLIPIVAFVFLFLYSRFCEEKKGIVILLVTLLLFGLAVYNFFTSRTFSAFFGIVLILLVSILFFRSFIKKWRIPLICLFAVACFSMAMSSGFWWMELSSKLGSLGGMLVESVYADTETETVSFENDPASCSATIDFINSGTGFLQFSINGNEMRIVRNNANLSYELYDSDNKQIFIRQIENSGIFEIMDNRFHDYLTLSLVRIDDILCVSLSTCDYDWVFRYDNDLNTFMYKNMVGKEVLLSPIAHSSLIKPSNYSFGSYRGRIWATAIPLLSKYIVKGSGADTFAFVFPQNDYVTQYNLSGKDALNVVTDKAHNLYIQYWINTGLLSLLAWLVLVIHYLVGAVKSFHKHGFNEFSDFVNAGIFCGIVGFLTTALFIDGSVNTMPMFYTMLGTGFAINAKDNWVKMENDVVKESVQMPEI